jgi:Domain of unknown function (DUF305)
MKNPTVCAFWILLAYALWLSAISTVPSSVSARMAEADLDKSMERMHAEMQKVHYSGNADADFASLMVPHHQGAIQMAEVELQFGSDPHLRRLAEEIIVTQQSEIDLMNSVIRGFPLNVFWTTSGHGFRAWVSQNIMSQSSSSSSSIADRERRTTSER